MTEQKFPTAGPDDSDEVTLALTTANSLWQSGDKDEALRWLKKAVENAEEAGDTMRSVELARAAADLKTAAEQSASASDSEGAEPSKEKDSFQPKAAEATPLDEPSRPKLSKPPKPPPAPKTRLDTPLAKSQNGKSRPPGGANGHSKAPVPAASAASTADGPVLTQALRVGIKRSLRDGELLVARLAEDGDVPAGYHEALVVLVDPSKDVLDKLS